MEKLVFIIDDDPAIRLYLKNLLTLRGYQPEAFATTAEFLTYQRKLVPSCLILDVQLGEASGLDFFREIQSVADTMPIIFITGYGTIRMGVGAIKDGAVEFLTKPINSEQLLGAVAEALEKSRQAITEQQSQDGKQERWSRLTPREREVVDLVVAGLLNKQIAHQLGVAEQTIKAHRSSIMKKLEIRRVAELVRLASDIARPLPK
jgi:FixJ family two-component response regulator